MNTSRVLSFLCISFCLCFISSCAGVGAVVTIAAFGVEGYEEARVHRPDLKLEPLSSYLPNLPFSPKEHAKRKDTKDSASNAPAAFGFECSKLGDKEKQSKCFNDFSKALAQQEEKLLKSKAVTSSKKEENLTTLQKIAKTLKVLPAKVVKKLSSPQNNLAHKEKKPTTPQSLPSSFIQSWASSWEKRDIRTYLSFYSNAFKGSKSHRGEWEVSRHRAFKRNKNISIQLSDIKINQKDTKKIAVNFIQKYRSDGYSDTGLKELLIENEGVGWKIIKETWMTKDSLANNNSSTDPSKQVAVKLAGWLQAWEHQDVTTYLSFYSDKFKMPKGSSAKWKNTRHRALRTNKISSIQLSNLQTSHNKNIIELNFIQRFNSMKFSDVGIKELVWIKTGGDWKILKETWMPI